MARRRFQAPKPTRVGKWWYLLSWQDEFVNGRRIRRRKRTKLAPATMLEREVRKIAAEVLRPLNQGLISVGSGTKFEDFVASVYKPTVLPLLAKTTQDRYSSVLKNYLIPTFGQACLRDVTPLVAQRYFSKMAGSKLGYESRDKIRDVLSSVLGSAVQFGLLVKNPVEGLRLPPSKKGRRAKPYITPQQFHALMALISEPYATMVFVAVSTGLPGSNLLCIIVLIACIIILVVNELTRPNANLGLGISVGGDLVRGGAGKLDRIYKRRNQAIASNMRSRKKWEIEVFRRHTTAKSLERDIRVSRRLCLGVSA